MKQSKNITNQNSYLALFTNHVHWISAVLLILGFIMLSIDKNSINNNLNLNQLTVTPILLLMGYGLFIFVVIKKRRD